jgi:DNA-binding response OmpR family regulator
MELEYFEFGIFRLDPKNRLLLQKGERVSLTSKMLGLLLVLVSNAGTTISCQEVLNEIWQGGARYRRGTYAGHRRPPPVPLVRFGQVNQKRHLIGTKN